MRAYLFSVHRRHFDAMVQGAKNHEYRRGRVNIQSGDILFFYATKPTGAIVGKAHVGDVLVSQILQLDQLEPDASVREAVKCYLDGASFATAIQICGLEVLDPPLSLADLQLARAPQAYQEIKL